MEFLRVDMRDLEKEQNEGNKCDIRKQIFDYFFWSLILLIFLITSHTKMYIENSKTMLEFQLGENIIIVDFLGLIILVYALVFLLICKKLINNEKRLIKLIKYRIFLLSTFFIFIYSLCSYRINNMPFEFSTNKNIALFFIITLYFLYVLIFKKGEFIGLTLFAYKYKLMKKYYKKLEELSVDESGNISRNKKVIPRTNNGGLIGITESLLYITIFVFFGNQVTLIGIILAVRSYVTITSHQNKEESEFYIIGTLGSLLYTIGIFKIYSILIECFTGITI